MKLLAFKLREMKRSFGHYVNTGDFEHLWDMVLIAMWDGRDGEEVVDG